jgi:uncharacterized protein (UPF0335 family)
MAYDVFVSFKSEDKDLAEKICDNLDSKGIKCWISSRGIRGGQNYQEEIVKALKDAAIMVLVFSAAADKSDEIKKELGLASKYKKHVIPVRIEDFLPGEKYEYEMTTRQYIDLFRNWEKEIAHLADDIKFMMANTAGHGQQVELEKTVTSQPFVEAANELSKNTLDPYKNNIQIDATKEIVTWPDAGITFLMNFKKRFDPTGLPFKPFEISSDEEITEELEVDWFVDDTYYFSVFLPHKRLDKVDLRWGYYSTNEKRDPLFRKRSQALCQNKIWLNDAGDILIDGDRYYFNSEEGYLGFETSQRRTISSLGDPALVELIANKLKVFSQGVWPIIVETK